MIYDCFTFNGELDILEIRLNILDPYVDYFVIGESSQTFSGKDKPLYYEQNKERFKKWWPKIIVIESPAKEFWDSFKRAFYQKEYLTDVLKLRAQDDDVVYYGDVDEIWKPQNITDDKVYNLEQLNYCYYLNNRSSEMWVGTIVGKWETIKNNTLSYWRANHTNQLPNSGWHFTNMGGIEQILKKLDAYDHQEFNTESIKTLLQERIENGKDYVGRRSDWLGRPFEFWRDETELPEYVIINRQKYVAYFRP